MAKEAQFVMRESDESAPKTVTKVGKLSPVMIEYIDGKGEKGTKVALVSESGNTVLLFQERITGQNVIAPASPWLVEALKKHRAEQKDLEQV